MNLSFNLIPNTLGRILRNNLRMTMETVKQNAEIAKQTISALKSELSVLNNEYNVLRAQQLREENAKLLAAVEMAKKRLISLEVSNGVKQIAIPTQNLCVKVDTVEQPAAVEQPQKAAEVKESKPKKEKKPAKEKPAPAPEAPVDVGRLDLRVAKIEDVQRHPDADSLYLLKINCGEEKPRNVCSGLVKFVPMDDLKDRSVVLLCNLKPVKMRGVTSEAMVMCASTPEKVEVLLPPADSKPGDHVHCDGYTRQPDAVMNPKKKIFETVAPDLHTNDSLQACYKGIPFTIPGKGMIVSQTLKNVSVK
ncbi:PREDICTED: aminoacyl tRNA synthase complex-interacting multifunctional protein 1 [Nicrophorus vespilloides]|uniref:Aminoacyl tRNA synthase complex-interacting multifunctional protein 1 n=1 Tax=Nicrophorus vespilloides TaxID=110193 RepID=A0ABM1M320_NICVS|nr:PREDICTED: aminoacyl tRNA synthase complex-interacting multifunctional protein 1 [Nicrophorus vespilloides]